MLKRSTKLSSNLTNVQDRHRNFARNVVKDGIEYFCFDSDLNDKINLNDHRKIGKLGGR
jgi:uncharacterized membrane protein